MKNLNFPKQPQAASRAMAVKSVNNAQGWLYAIIVFLLVLATASTYAQAPTIKYASPQSYIIDEPIVPLVPTATNVGAFAYGTRTALTSGITKPGGIAVDAAGNIYVVDQLAGYVVKIPAGGGTSVRINHYFSAGLDGVTVDGAGNIYVSQTNSPGVYKLPVGGGAGIAMGTSLSGIKALVVSKGGNVYAATATSVAQVFPGTESDEFMVGFGNIVALSVDSYNNVYVSDQGNKNVVKINENAWIRAVVASGFSPGATTTDAANNLYISNATTGKIEVVRARSNVVTNELTASVTVKGLAIDSFDNLYVSDLVAPAISEYKLAGGYIINSALPIGLAFDNTTGIIKGKPITLAAATNYMVTAINSGGHTTATLNLAVVAPNPRLANLTVSTGTLSPVFARNSFTYNLAEALGLNTLYITPTAVDTNSVIKVNGVKVRSGKAAPVTLATGANTIGIVITGADSITTKTYTIIVGKGSQNANLSGLRLSSGTLSPVFAQDSTSYTSSVSKTTASMTVTPRTATSTSTVEVNGVAVPSGTASGPIALSGGLNVIKIVVTAQDGVTIKSYTVTVTRPYPATLAAGKVTGRILACTGDASAPPNVQQFTVSGNLLDGNITATAPANFEVSISPRGNYGPVAVLTQVGGVVSNKIVYVRSAPTASIGNIEGNVQLASVGAISQVAYVRGIVNALGTANPLSNQTVFAGATTAAINLTGTASFFNWTNDTPGIGLAASGTGNIAAFTAANTGSSPLTATITVTPQSPPARAYIANTGNNNVAVVDVGTGSLPTAHIPVGSNPQSLSVSPDGQRAYVSNTGSNSISVINTATNTVIYTINIGTSIPGQLVVSPDGSRLYVVNTQGAGSVLVISTATNTQIASIPVPSAPYGITISPDGSKMYVTLPGTNHIALFNTATNTLIKTILVGQHPLCVAVSPDGSRVYVTNFDSSNLSVIDASTNLVIATVPNEYNPVAVVVSPDGSRIYVANSGEDDVTVIDAATNSPVAYPSVGHMPYGLSLTPGGTQLYVSNFYSGGVSVINTATNLVGASIETGAYPLSIGNFITSGTGCPGPPVKFTITVNPVVTTLSNLTLSAGTLSPAFSPDSINYKVTADAGVSTLTVTPTVTDTKATITVNGIAVATGTPSAAIPLTTGLNTIMVVVTGEDGTTIKTYTIRAGKGASDDDLSDLKLSSGTINPVFAAGTNVYTATVANTVSSITVTPDATVSTSTITVNGMSVASGVASASLPLTVGSNIINVTVTAQDGVTQQTYTVMVTRIASANANLASLKFTPGVLTPGFSTANTNYTINVVNGVGAVTVTPTSADATATITVNGIARASGTATAPIHIQVGDNAFTVMVTAQNGTAIKTYTVTLTRAAASANNPNITQGDQSLAEDGITVHQGLSPNGDGVNDVLTIDGIQQYPDNKLTIIDRNGAVVFEAKGYDISNKVFDGHNSKTGKMQLPGTYYYSLEYNVGGVTKHKTGYIVMKY